MSALIRCGRPRLQFSRLVSASSTGHGDQNYVPPDHTRRHSSPVPLCYAPVFEKHLSVGVFQVSGTAGWGSSPATVSGHFRTPLGHRPFRPDGCIACGLSLHLGIEAGAGIWMRERCPMIRHITWKQIMRRGALDLSPRDGEDSHGRPGRILP